MRGTSRISLQGVADRFRPVLSAAGAGSAEIGEQLFALADALDGNGSLRRTLTDPSIDAEAKVGLARRLLADARPEVGDVVADLVAARWSSADDLGESIEELGFWALLEAADAAGELARTEEELFQLGRALTGQREARHALADPTASRERRAALAEALLAGQASDATVRIARRAAVSGRHRFIETLTHVGDLAAFRRGRVVASVTSRTELSASQRERLSGILAQTYGSDIQVNVSVDPMVLGGLRVQVGPQVVDATVLSRLDDARRQLAG